MGSGGVSGCKEKECAYMPTTFKSFRSAYEPNFFIFPYGNNGTAALRNFVGQGRRD
jgi:hypothetical protein